MYSDYNNMNNRKSGTTDLYEILGVNKDAPQEEIKKAYRSLSLQFHPDRNNNSPESTTKYQEINSAYEILGDEQERSKYDRTRNSPFMHNGQGQGPVHMNTADIFNFLNKNIFEQMGAMNIGGMTFGPMNVGPGGMHMHMANAMEQNGMQMNGLNGLNGMHSMGPMQMHMEGIKHRLMKPPPIIKTEELLLSKTYNGCKMPINITRWVVENGIKREENETIYLPVPKGVDDNEMIILQGKGNSLGPNNTGDVKITLKIFNDTAFIRSGLDLILNKTITLKEALCGFSFDLTHIDGRTFKINNGSGNIITPNYSKIINNMGLTREEHVGNLLINFTVELPRELTPAQIEALMNIL